MARYQGKHYRAPKHYAPRTPRRKYLVIGMALALLVGVAIGPGLATGESGLFAGAEAAITALQQKDIEQDARLDALEAGWPTTTVPTSPPTTPSSTAGQTSTTTTTAAPTTTTIPPTTTSTASTTTSTAPAGVINAGDYPSLQTAINAAQGRKVYIPAGTWPVSGSLSVPNGSYIYGAGATETVIRPSGSSWVFDLGQTVGVTVRDLGLASGGQGYGFWTGGASDLTLTNLRFTDMFWGIKSGSSSVMGHRHTYTGIVAVNCLRPMYISDLETGTFLDWDIDALNDPSSNQTHGLYLERNAWDITFTNTVFRRGSGYGLHLYGAGNVHDIVFNNCTVDARQGRRSIYIDSGYDKIYFNDLYLPGQTQNDSSAALMRMANPTDIHITGLEAHGYRLIYGGSGSVSGVFYGSVIGTGPGWDTSGLTFIRE